MLIGVHYNVNKKEYENIDNLHQIMLITTEYQYKDDILVHLQIGHKVAVAVNNFLKDRLKRENILSKEHFIHKRKPYSGRGKSITRQAFEKKLNQFEPLHMEHTREILEEYGYINKMGEHDLVQIITRVKGDDIKAEILFKDEEQFERFRMPKWFALD